MTISAWCYLLGFLLLATGVVLCITPQLSADLLNKLPRNKIAGYILSTIAWIWATNAILNMGLDIILPWQKFIPILTLIFIPLTWIWLDNLLSCRAIGGLLTLFPYNLLMVARIHPSAWRLVLITLAYIWIICGMILLLYPWKMRECIVKLSASLTTLRLTGAIQAVLGLVLIILGITVLV